MLRRVLCLLSLLFVVGCGDEPSQTVSGVVKLDGKPIAGVTLTFFTSNNKTVNADTNKEGRYSAVIVGRGQVQVTAQVPPPRPAPRPDPPAFAAQKGDAVGQAKGDDEAKMSRMPDPSEAPPGIPLDPKFNDPKRSGLEFTLTGADMTQDFELTTITGKSK